MLTHCALPPPAAQAGEVAAAATVALANRWKSAGGCPDAQVLVFVDGEKRNQLKEKRGGTKAAEEEDTEAVVDPDMEAPDPVDEAAAAPPVAVPDAGDGYTEHLAHHLGELAKRDGRLHVLSCPGDAENAVAALCTMLRGESMGSSLDADSSVFEVASRVIMQATLLEASHERRQTWNVRELFRRMRKGEPAMERQLVAHGVGALEGDYYQDYVVKDGKHGFSKRLDAVIKAEAATRLALAASFLSDVPPTLLEVVRTWIHKLAAALQRCGVQLKHEDGTPYTPQDQDAHTRAVLAAQLMRLTTAPTRAWCAALRAGAVTPVEVEVAFLVPDLSGRWWEDGAEWRDVVLPAVSMLAELRKPENADLKAYLDKFHSAYKGGVEAEEEELRRRNCRPTPLAVPPKEPSRTLAELAAVIPASILAAVSPGCDVLAQPQPPYRLPGGVWGAYGYPDLLMPRVTDDYTVARLGAVQAASISSAATAVMRLCLLHDPERGLPTKAYGPDCHVLLYKTCTLLLEARFSGREVLIFADREAKTLLVISIAPDAGDDAVYEVALNRTYADLIGSKQRVRRTPTPDAASVVFVMGGPLRKHPLRLDPPLSRGKELNAAELYVELTERQPMLKDLARVLETRGREGWPAEDAEDAEEADWIDAAAPPAGAAPLRQIGELFVRLPATATPARVQAAEAALAAVQASRAAAVAARVEAAQEQAQALPKSDAGQLAKVLGKLKAETGAARSKRPDLAKVGDDADREAKRLRRTDVPAAMVVANNALSALLAAKK